MDKTTLNNNEKVGVIVNRIREILRSLPYKQANLIAYALRPDSTAIGADFCYNEQQTMDCFYEGLAIAVSHPDANSEYTLNQVYEKVESGEI